MDQIKTDIGTFPRNQLAVTDTIHEEGNKRIFTSEWRMGADVVRRDVFTAVLWDEPQPTEAPTAAPAEAPAEAPIQAPADAPAATDAPTA